MQTPKMARLPADLAQAARTCAETLRAGGYRGWIVGGAVRDLALGRAPADIDLASSATPGEVERLFERTTPVGREFGTVLVHVDGYELQHTTFRREGGYRDARRPDEVRYGESLEEDAERRDFTCNALYLDPLEDETCDPTGGLEDLERGVLRCVGDPVERFSEDGLRLLRMARFAARYALDVEPATATAARASAAALSGVSAERVLAEVGYLLGGPRPELALELLAECGLLERLFPGLAALHPSSLNDEQAFALRRAALAHLGGAQPDLGLERGLAILFDPSPRDPVTEPGEFERARALLAGLRPSRRTERAVLELWRVGRDAEALLLHGLAPRAERIRLVRNDAWPGAVRVLEAWCAAREADGAALRGLVEFRRSLSEEQLRPAALLSAADFEQAGVPRGPRWGQLLLGAETAQLNGELSSSEEARAWLARQLER